MTFLLVLIGGAIGAPARYLTDQLIQSKHATGLPWGTLTVNIVGSLVLGIVAGGSSSGELPTWVLTIVGTGFCGALTTFSTFGYETVRLVTSGRHLWAAFNVLCSLFVGLAAVALGWVLGQI